MCERTNLAERYSIASRQAVQGHVPFLISHDGKPSTSGSLEGVKQSGRTFFVILCLFFVTATFAFASTSLRSPWDARRVELSASQYTCPQVEHLSPNVTMQGYYIDSKSSIVDPARWKAYGEASAPYRRLGQSIVNAADDYRATGSKAAGLCALQLMDAAAQDGVFTGTMSSRQAYYVQGWIMGAIAIAYLKVRDSGLVTAHEKGRLFPWFEKVAGQTEEFYEQNHAKNNHLYWAGVEIAAVGIATGDQHLFDWGVSAYRTGIEQIGQDGTMPLEMHRGRRALHYHLYALAPLVYLAEFGAVNGIRLYSEDDSALMRLVHFCVASENDPASIERLAGVPQEAQPGALSADLVSWAKIWQSRYQDPEVSSLLQKSASLSSLYLGGLPPGFHSTTSRER